MIDTDFKTQIEQLRQQVEDLKEQFEEVLLKIQKNPALAKQVVGLRGPQGNQIIGPRGREGLQGPIGPIANPEQVDKRLAELLENYVDEFPSRLVKELMPGGCFNSEFRKLLLDSTRKENG
jgi:hypothetical protein